MAFLLIPPAAFCQENSIEKQAARSVIARTFGDQILQRLVFKIEEKDSEKLYFEYEVDQNKLYVTGNSGVSLCHGFYDYIKSTHQGMISWSGKHLMLKPSWIPVAKKKVVSPYQYHYYLNVVTHGYSTPYWDWKRWEEELDWMAVHGIDMPLLPGAFEAIMYRVYKKIGLSEKEISGFFTGPAHLPWNRMGNITGWDGPLPASFFEKQISLTHKMLRRARELGMQPIIPAFAGFVPPGIQRVYPDAKVRELSWGGFARKYAAHLLVPDSRRFTEIGELFIREWEKEFGKNEFYLADSFNEMEVPAANSESELSQQLSAYGEAVYQSIQNGNPEAKWVMMGWTFPYYRDISGKLFWTPQRLAALLDKVPNDKMMILDLANEYNRDFWKIDPSWKMYNGFFDKAWVYSFIPNMGGKTPWNGILKTYAEAPAEALQYEKKGKLVGFGMAPEGIENNEVIYELISDMAYTEGKIDLEIYLKNYCINRYGAYPQNMKKAFDLFLQSCYGTFTDHPRFNFQINAAGTGVGTVNQDSAFFTGVELFLSCSDSLSNSSLYVNDALELSVQYIALYAQKWIQEAQTKFDYSKIGHAVLLLEQIDTLLLSHPTQRLSRWVDWARGWGDTPAEKDYYESNAKRIITTWGGEVDDYSARMWSGLVKHYYGERMRLYYLAKKEKRKFDVADWEENWIMTPYFSEEKAFMHPLEEAKAIIKEISIRE